MSAVWEYMEELEYDGVGEGNLVLEDGVRGAASEE